MRTSWLALSAWAALAAASILPDAMAQPSGTKTVVQQSLVGARMKVRELTKRTEDAQAAQRNACALADEHDARLAASEETAGLELKRLADSAILQRKLCKEAMAALGQVRYTLEAAQDDLREAALAAVAPGPAVAVVAPAAVPASASKSLSARAAGARGQVSARRGELDDAYAIADKAAQLALQQADAGNAEAPRLAAEARAAFDDAFEARRAARAAQYASNDMVRSALDALRCKQADADCRTAEQQALEAEARLTDRLAQSKDAYEKAKLATYGIDAATRYTDPVERANAVTLLRTLDAYPDARSLFGPESYRLAASTAGSRASIKIGLDRLFGAGQAQTSLILSTPAAKQGRSSLIDSVDGLASAATLELGHTFVKGIGLKDDVFSGFRALGVSATVGQDRREYRELQDLSGVTELSKLPDLRSRNTVPWALSVYGSLAAADGTFLHLFKASAQRSYKDQDETIACPVPIPGDDARFSCVSARFGAPKAETARVFSYEARWKWKDGALSAKVSYNDKRHVTELEVPIYLIRSADDKKGGSFNGGINLGWSSKTGGQVGLFVDAPFSMFGLD